MRNKGFTAIELILALGLLGIFVPSVFSAALFSLKTLNNIDRDVELQQQAQFIFSFMEDKIIDSTGIIQLEDKSGVLKHNTTDKVYLKKIIFRNLHCDKKGYIFGLIKDSAGDYYNIKYNTGTIGPATVDLGNYIESMEVEPIPADKVYAEAEGIFIKINFVLDGYRSTFENSYQFRNSGGRL